MKNNIHLIMLSGLPASGKSTLAEKIQKDLKNSVRVNKDLLRKMMYFGNFSWKNEKEVNDVELDIVRYYLGENIDVIVDDTNLLEYHENKWKSIAKEFNAEFIKVELNTPIDICIERDKNRIDSVGEYTIKNFALQTGKVTGEFVICDLDGTICNIDDRKHLVSSNSDKNWKEFFDNIPNDKPRWEVINYIYQLNKIGFKIIYVSGRPEDYKKQTIEWLKEHNADFNYSLIMRKSGDKRPDTDVKKEILDKYFKDKIKIFTVIDDRPSVIRMWKENKLDVIDVGDGIDF